MRLSKSLWIAPALFLVSSCVTMSQYSVAPQRYSGVRLYQVFCASCHGLTGHGDGPVEPLLRRGVPDLTTLVERNGGRFPTAEIAKIIDGRTEVPAHGARDMPVWGYEFYGETGSDQTARAQADRAIMRLVKYLQTIQSGY